MKNTSRHLQNGIVLAEKYQIEEGIGDGGFSLTYRAKDLALERTVAIKEFFPRGMVERGEDGKMVVANNNEEDASFFREEKEKFIEEGRRLAKFYSLPGVVSVLNFFMENGTAYLVMDYIDGETLAQRLKSNGKPFAVKEILEDLRPVVLALQKIHEAGLVHRDISPDNIMISREDNKVYLIDFGTARVSNSGSDHALSVYYRPDGYTPVEQLRSNGQQGPWTDVYAFCATVYRCITGNCPDDVQSRLEEDGLKRPSSLGVEILPEVEDALMAGLSLYARDRIQDMKELFHRLYDPGVTMPGPKEVEEEPVTMPVTVPGKAEPKPLPKPLPAEEDKAETAEEPEEFECPQYGKLPEPGRVEIGTKQKKASIKAYIFSFAFLIVLILTIVIAMDADKYGVEKHSTTSGTTIALCYDLYEGEYAGGEAVYFFDINDQTKLVSVNFYDAQQEVAKIVTINEDGRCLEDGSLEKDYTLSWKKRKTDLGFVEGFLKENVPYITLGDHIYSGSFQEKDGSYCKIYLDEDGDPTSQVWYHPDENYTQYTYYYKGGLQKSFQGKYVGKYQYDEDKDGVTRIIEARSWYEDGSEQMVRYYEDGKTYYKEYDENGKLIEDKSWECTLATE